MTNTLATRTLKDGRVLALVAVVLPARADIDMPATNAVDVCIDGNRVTDLRACPDGSVVNLRKHATGVWIASAWIASEPVSIVILDSERQAVLTYLAPTFAAAKASRDAATRQAKNAAAYDDLQNEGHSDGYNPHRDTNPADGDNTPWQKGDNLPS